MSHHIDAVYVDGVFRPEQPVNIAPGERVALIVESKSAVVDDLTDVHDLLDSEYIESCRRMAGKAPTIEAVRKSLGTYAESLSQLISEERDER